MARKRSYKKESEKSKVAKELKEDTPIVVRFYKETCPACQMSRPAWDQFCAKMDSSPYRVIEVEEAAIPEEVLRSISAFPTYAKHDSNGSSHTVGAILDASEIPSKLKLK